MSTTDEQRLREALTELVAHCGEQGWWMKSHAIAVMDKAQAAVSEPAAPVDARDDITDEQIDAAMSAYAALAVPAWCSNRHRPAMAAALRAALARQAAAPAEGK